MLTGPRQCRVGVRAAGPLQVAPAHLEQSHHPTTTHRGSGPGHLCGPPRLRPAISRFGHNRTLGCSISRLVTFSICLLFITSLLIAIKVLIFFNQFYNFFLAEQQVVLPTRPSDAMPASSPAWCCQHLYTLPGIVYCVVILPRTTYWIQ